MKAITFTVQIQAGCPCRSPAGKAATLRLCQGINSILTRYDGMSGAAQIIPPPRNIKVTTTPDD